MAVAAEITGDADLGMVRNREIGIDDHPPTAIEFAARGLCQLLSQMGWFDSSGPDHRCRLDTNIPIWAADHNLSGSHGLDAALGYEFHAIQLKGFLGFFGELFWHRSQNPVAGVHQHDSRFLGIKLFEGTVQSPSHEL